MDRDERGRFVARNTLCYAGWQALVEKRFGGNEEKCKEWWGRMGAFTYAKMALEGTPNAGKLPYWHPGSPEQFLERQSRMSPDNDVDFPNLTERINNARRQQACAASGGDKAANLG